MAQQEVFYEVLSGAKKLPVYDVDAHNKLASARTDLDNLSGTVTSHTTNTNIHVTTEDKAKWNKVTEKVDTTAFEQYKTSAETELNKKVNETDFNEYKTSAGNELAKKLNAETFNTYTATADVTPYTPGANIDITNHVVSGKSWQDEIDTASAAALRDAKTYADDKDAATRTWATDTFQPVGNYVSADDFNELAGKVDEIDRDLGAAEVAIEALDREKLDTSATDGWDVEEYTPGADITIVGHEIGVKENSFVRPDALGNYYTKDECDETFQPIGNYVSASDLDNYYTKTEVDDLIEPFTTSAEVEEMVDELAADVNEALSGLYNTEVVAGYGIQVEATTDPQTGDKTFEISTDPSVLNYGLFNTYGTQRYASSTLDLEFVNNGDIQGENITLNTTTHQVVLAPGSYHIDIQVDATLDANTTLSNDYFVAVLTAGPQPERSVKMSVDASYPHTETFTLSYDLVIDGDTEQSLSLTMNNLPVGTNVYAKMNIHQILTLQAAAEAISNNYRAGNGMALENNTFSVKNGNGLEFTNEGSLQLKLGNGLTFTTEGGVEALTINTEVGGVVETVKELEDAISTKITTNYPPTMITDSHGQVMGGTQYTPGNAGCLYGTLFNTPITHPIIVGKTLLGIYSFTDNIEAILGIYEYQPDYDRGNGDIGRTVALCDTGIVTIKKGFNEFPIVHLNNTIGGVNPETTPEMKTNCMYYATIYLGYKSRHGSNDLQVACAAGYSPQYGSIKPALSMANVNNISANIENNDASYDADLSFNDMGFNWQYTSYPDKSASTSSQYFEACSAPRMYMQIRNKK